MIAKDKPLRSPRYLRLVADLGCCICGGQAVAHHITGGGIGRMGGKESDFMTLPLCERHHTGDEGVHRDWAAWERMYGRQVTHISRTVEKILKGAGAL